MRRSVIGIVFGAGLAACARTAPPMTPREVPARDPRMIDEAERRVRRELLESYADLLFDEECTREGGSGLRKIEFGLQPATDLTCGRAPAGALDEPS
jgi:hypothetical protein